MQLHIDDNLINQAKRLSDSQTEGEIIESALQLWIKIKQTELKKLSIPEMNIILNRFIGCALGNTQPYEEYKEKLALTERPVLTTQRPLRDFIGTLKNTNIFNGDLIALQRAMRDEWD